MRTVTAARRRSALHATRPLPVAGSGLSAMSGTGCAAVRERRTAGRAGAAVLVAVIALALAACAGPLKPVALPHKSTLPSLPAPSPSPTESMEQQVSATMTNYNMALEKAEKSNDAAQASALLSPYLDPDSVKKTVAVLTSLWSQGEIFYGDIISHVLRVTVDGTSAVAYDCDDTSSAGREYAANGKVVPGSQGVPDLNLATQMSLDGDHWTIGIQTIADKPCKP